MDDLTKLAEEECYNDLANSLKRLVSSFMRQYGMSRSMVEGYEELLSIANELFIYANRTHDTTLGDYGKRIRYVVWSGLLDHITKLAKRSKQCRQLNIDFDNHESEWLEQAPEFLPNLLANLSDDAKGVVRLVLDPPKEASRFMTAANWRKRLTKTLLGMGWTTVRIAQAFSEIAQALK